LIGKASINPVYNVEFELLLRHTAFPASRMAAGAITKGFLRSRSTFSVDLAEGIGEAVAASHLGHDLLP